MLRVVPPTIPRWIIWATILYWGRFFSRSKQHITSGNIFSPRTSTVFPYTPKSPHNSSFPPNGTGILGPHTHKTGDKCESYSPYNSKLWAGVKWGGSEVYNST